MSRRDFSRAQRYQGKNLSRRRSLLPSFTPSMAAGMTDKLRGDWRYSECARGLGGRKLNSAELLLIGAVLAIGVFHTMVPDHWLPIVLMARQGKWSTLPSPKGTFGAPNKDF
jgi:hypothetical protein